MMKHELPALPYNYNALEPHYNEQTLRLHHSAHHKSYVDGLNNAETKLEQARLEGDYSLIKHWERELAFHGSGHLLHNLFWESMSPRGGDPGEAAVTQRINQDFGSFDAFKEHFSKAAATVEGSGWALLCWHRQLDKLLVLTSEKHQNLSIWGAEPLMVIDMWEHAYYLQYQNKKAAYIEAWWNLINWDEVNKKFATATK